LTADTSAHPGHPQKRLFAGRWYQQVVGGDYGAWMTLSTSDVWLNCDSSEAVCGSKWYAPFDAGIGDWNGQATTVDFQYREGERNINYDVNVFVEEEILAPDILGIAFGYDANGDFCDPDACTFYYYDVILADDAHVDLYGTLTSRQATVAHELGHAIQLKHESATEDSSEHFPCGQDEFGNPIPHSIMAYNCSDPVPFGFGEYWVQEWDVCGVNHAYYDPGVGFAGCGTEPTPSATPTATPPPLTTPTMPPGGGGRFGDVDCSGGVDSVDALKILRYVADLPTTPVAGCPPIGGPLSGLPVLGGPLQQGDVDCSGAVDSVDALKVLRYVADLPTTPVQGCPPIGSVIGGATATPTPTSPPTPTSTPPPAYTPTPSTSNTFLFASFYTEPDEFRGTITGVIFLPTIPGSGFYDPLDAPAGATFLLVYMTVENIGTSPDDVGIFSFRLRDSISRGFTMDFPDGTTAQLTAESYTGRKGTYDTIQPGATDYFVFVFLVPNGASGLTGERCPMSGGCDANLPSPPSPPAGCTFVFSSFYSEPNEFCATSVSVTKVASLPACGYDDGVTAPSGMSYALVFAHVQNYGFAADDVGIFSFRLRSGANIYTMDFDGQSDAQSAAECNYDRLGTYETIQPGVSYDMVFAFLVPTSASGLTPEDCPESGCD
jgi:hypothetical protein